MYRGDEHFNHKARYDVTSLYVPRATCPVCGERDLAASAALDVPSICNILYSDADSAREAATGRLTVTHCRNCAHIFNSTFEEARISYTQSYDSSLEFSPRFAAFSQELSVRLNETYTLAGKTIIDIGCGKGDFLNRLCALAGATGVGFDKSFDETRREAVSGVTFVQDYFDDRYTGPQPDFVTCRHVIEHIAEPVAFLRALRAHPRIGPETIFYFEMPNAVFMLRDAGIWDLIHEHVSYFTPSSLRTAFERAGFEIIETGTSFGEQYLYVEARPAPVQISTRSSGGGGIESLVMDFEMVYRRKIDHWRSYFAAHFPAGTVVWGAGSKGVTFVNLVPGAGRAGTLVDVNPHKQGLFAPRHGTPVIAPDELRGRPVEAIIVMNPIYLDEIAREAASLAPAAHILLA